MSESLPLPLQDRPDPAVLLIDAVINRQGDLAQRLSQQLVHRQGVEALEAFVQTTLLRSCGSEAVTWLREQLGGVSAAPATGVGSLIKDALQEAMAPLRQSNAARALPPSSGHQAPDPWEPTPLQVVRPLNPAPSGKPAPRPADLADLRSWLSSDAA